jgi:hypothetical protein
LRSRGEWLRGKSQREIFPSAQFEALLSLIEFFLSLSLVLVP